MELEPRSLGIPLHRKDRLVLVLLAACALVALGAWCIDAPLGVAFLATCILVLPPMCVGLLSTQASRPSGASSSRLGLVGVALFVAYAALSKSVLLPVLLRWLSAV